MQVDVFVIIFRFYHKEEFCSFVTWRNNSPQYRRVQCRVASDDEEQ